MARKPAQEGTVPQLISHELPKPHGALMWDAKSDVDCPRTQTWLEEPAHFLVDFQEAGLEKLFFLFLEKKTWLKETLP